EILTRLAKQYLTEDGLAPTALNTYLKSPAEFFATCILRIKEPPQGPMILGNAVHGAIASFLNGTPAETAASEIDRCFRTSLL
ncbi:PD-(D/E)XK nuclease family protein, partial [Streptomyces brasiliscabiei]|uniref:PD-(D/E)XK nuclease family protein n=1 Tax=Streptomyces brasiliscabiei TaxID=2736302 RepID=UPI003014A21E